MSKWYEGYENYPNFKIFDEILKIPRGSFHEEKMADYVEGRLKAKGLETHRNSLGDIIAYLPASKGRENEEPLMLQAHMDMVCMKTPESTHDFAKDEIKVFAEDGWLKTYGTTLGADDGAGDAMMLALLEEKDLSNPPVELVFTVQEEDGMGGAKGLDFSLLKSKRMIGLDGLTEGATIFSASAVEGGKLIRNAAFTQAEGNCYSLNISGLTSGHGANNIGQGLGNAIKLAGRILYRLNKALGIRLASITGGTMVHTIPPETVSVFKCAKAEAEVKAAFDEISAKIKKEYAVTDPNLKIECVKTDADTKCMTEEDTKAVLELLFVLPVGAQKVDINHLERVIESYNVSTANTYENRIEFDYVSRANMPSDAKELFEAAEIFVKPFCFEYVPTFNYGGHTVDENSPLTLLYEKAIKEKTDRAFERMYIHSGLDAGTIFTSLGMNDLIVCMPDVKDVHTPRERMSLASFAETYTILKEILKNA